MSISTTYTAQVETHDELGFSVRQPLCSVLCHHTTIDSARHCALASLYEAECAPGDLDLITEHTPVEWANFCDVLARPHAEPCLVATLEVTDSDGYDSVQVFRRLFVFDPSGCVSPRLFSVVGFNLTRRPVVQFAV